MHELFVSILSADMRELLHYDANRAGMDHEPYRQLMARIRKIVTEQIGAEGITPERND
jgi:hypothetical protein